MSQRLTVTDLQYTALKYNNAHAILVPALECDVAPGDCLQLVKSEVRLAEKYLSVNVISVDDVELTERGIKINDFDVVYFAEHAKYKVLKSYTIKGMTNACGFDEFYSMINTCGFGNFVMITVEPNVREISKPFVCEE